MRVALDTNFLYYLESSKHEPRQSIAQHLFDRLPHASIVIPAQVLGELHRILIRKQQLSREESGRIVLSWLDSYPILATDALTLELAIALSVTHHLSTWDAVILSSAAQADCRILLSEDMHHGFIWSGVTIVNPFREPRHPLLELALQE